jgi:hypothetical protein
MMALTLLQANARTTMRLHLEVDARELQDQNKRSPESGTQTAATRATLALFAHGCVEARAFFF